MKRTYRLRRSWQTTVITIIVALTATSSEATRPDRTSWEAGTQIIDYTSYFDGNSLLMFVSNAGSFAYDKSKLLGKTDGLYFPRGSSKTCVYSAGLWIGAKVSQDVRIAVAEYESEFVPGPMRNGTYQTDRGSYRVYKIKRGDTRSSNPDYRDWPYADGAPALKDDLGADVLDTLGYKIPLMQGDQTLWSVCNDANPTAHSNWDNSTAPLGVEVQTYCWGFDREGALGQTIFLRFTIVNKGSSRLDDAFISLWADPDVGNPSDDLVACNPALSLGYCYNDSTDGIYGTSPPSVGVALIQGPIVASAGDSAWQSGKGNWIHGSRDLGMTAFVKYINGTDPTSAQEAYNYMTGRYSDGSLIIDPTTLSATTYMHSGNPVTGSGWIDTDPSDRRFTLSSGPFTMSPGDTQEVVAAIIVGQGTECFGFCGDTVRAIHTTGASASATFAVILDSSRTTGHNYRVSFSDDGFGRYPWSLDDLTSSQPVATGWYNLSGDDNYPTIDGMVVKVMGTPPGVGGWEAFGTRRFTFAGGEAGLEGFGGAIGWASPASLFGSGNPGVHSRRLRDVALVLAQVDANGNFDPRDPNVSYGYRYGRRFAEPPARPEFGPFIKNTAGQGYDSQDFVKGVPLSAWDVESSPWRRLAVGFLESNVATGMVNGKWWPPDGTTTDNITDDGPREWLWIFDADYRTSPDPSLQVEAIENPLPIMYFLTVARRGDVPFSPGGSGEDEFLIIRETDYCTDADVFEFTSPPPNSGGGNTAEQISSITVLKRVEDAARSVFDADFGRVRYGRDNVVTARAGSPFSISVTAHGALDTVWLYYREGGSRSFDSVLMRRSAGAVTGSIPASLMSARGCEYYFRGTKSGVSATLPAARPLEHPYIVRTEMTNQQGGRLLDGAYQMVGFPFDVSPSSPLEVFEDDLGAPDATKWRLGRWNPETAGYDEYPAVGAIARGKGYWLVAKDGVRVGANGLSALPDTVINSVRFGKITLEPGWNQISTPFAFNITWGARIAEPGVETVVWQYTGGGYESASTLAPYTGYWVKNGDVVARTLLLPYVEAPESQTADAKKTTAVINNWQLNLRLSSAGAEDITNTVGVLPAATDGADQLDWSEPPPFDRFVSLAFASQDTGSERRLLSGDFRAAGHEGWRYDLLLRGNTGSPARLQIETGMSVPPGLGIVLLDGRSGEKWDLRQTGSIDLPEKLSEPGIIMTLLVGTPSFVETEISSGARLPISYSLNQNYPNPFNSSTVLRYSVAKAARVRLDVFDILGRRVRTLVDEFQSAGTHDVTWDGRDAFGRAAASGTYFYRLTAGEYSESRKMILLK